MARRTACFLLCLIAVSEASRIDSTIQAMAGVKADVHSVAKVMSLLMDAGKTSTMSRTDLVASLSQHEATMTNGTNNDTNMKHICRSIGGVLQDLTAASPFVGIDSASTCSSMCTSDTSCAAFSHTATDKSCSLFKSLPAKNYGYSSGVCVQRGGCSGTGNAENCIYYNMPNVQLTSYLSGSMLAVVSEEQASDDLCRSSCNYRIQSNCVGFEFQYPTSAFGGVGNCKLILDKTSATTTNNVTVGFCLAIPYFKTSVTATCWKGEPCGSLPQLATPLELGNNPGPRVELTVIEGPKQVIGNSSARSTDFVADFSNVVFNAYGQVAVGAYVDGAQCPAVAIVNVDDHDQQVYWRWDVSGFPHKWTEMPSSGIRFILMRMRDNCPSVLMYMILAAFVGLMSVKLFVSLFWNWKTSPENRKYITLTVLATGVSFIFVWDLYMAFSLWQCGDQLKDDFRV